MLTGAENSQLFITIVSAVLFLLNVSLAPIQNRLIDAQRIIIPSRQLRSANVDTKVLSGQVFFIVFIFTTAWLYGGQVFEILAGGYFVTLLVSTAMTVHNILFFRALSDPKSGNGQVQLSDAFGYRNISGRLASYVLLLLGLYAAFGHLQFLGAAFIIAATSIGFLRRARRAALK